MNRILDIEYADRCATVQAGVTNTAYHRGAGQRVLLRPRPVEPARLYDRRGNVSMNSGGAHCLKYGVTANNLLGLKIVTVEGGS